MTAAYLSIETAFSGGAFELVVLSLSVPEEISSFSCILRLECEKALNKRQVFAQKLDIHHT